MDPLLGACDLDALHRRRSVKWATYPDDVLPMFVAEMDFDIAEPVKAAVRAALEANDCGYPEPKGLGEAFSAFSLHAFGWAPDPAMVVAAPDAMTGIAEVVMAITEPGAGVVINPPVYQPFFTRIEITGRRIVEAPLVRDEAGSYDLDFEAISEALGGPGVGAYLLCNPHNPVGRCWSEDDLVRIAGLCERHRVPLLIDEIHAPLVLPSARHVPFCSLEGREEFSEDLRVFTFTSASKGWNIPGLKCGLAIANSPADVSLLSGRAEALIPGHLGVLATIAAFGQTMPWLEAVKSQIDENRHILAGLLADHMPRVGYVAPEAGYLAWLDFGELALGEDEATFFLREARVALVGGTKFGRQGEGYARLNMGTSPAILAEAVSRLAEAAERVRQV